ncbi:hypothetical protein [Thiobacillus sp.]|uniref:hypothetical protein n=1 Tax=Thiobacillus sp. TaxID=924 RepID=UPI0025E3F54C|nr:hypothetical protein [Thiobacillus sp.]
MTTWIRRYSARERSNHWLVAISFVLAALSGLALFHPAFFFSPIYSAEALGIAFSILL